MHLSWSAPGRVFDLGRVPTARVYEIVLQEGRPADILAYVDGVLLADLWGDLVLPGESGRPGTQWSRAVGGAAA